jgi:hypothetical protein
MDNRLIGWIVLGAVLFGYAMDAWACTPGSTRSCGGGGHQECVDDSPPYWAPCEGGTQQQAYRTPDWTAYTPFTIDGSETRYAIPRDSLFAQVILTNYGPQALDEVILQCDAVQHFTNIPEVGIECSEPLIRITQDDLDAIWSDTEYLWDLARADYWDFVVQWSTQLGCNLYPSMGNSCSPLYPTFPWVY